MADSTGLGYRGGAVVFAIGLAIIAAAYYWTAISRIVLFWAAFVLTRPLGATVGDFLDKPLNHGGLALSRYGASVALAALIVVLVATLPQPRREPAIRSGGIPLDQQSADRAADVLIIPAPYR